MHVSRRMSCHSGRRRAQRRSGGFTLLELVLTIAIIVLLALMVVPRLMSASPRLAAENEGMRLRADLAYAQQIAINEACAHKVVIDSTNDRVTIQRRDGASYTTTTERTLGQGVSIQSSTFTGGAVVFNLLGEPSEGGTIVLRGTNGSTVTVTVTPGTGHIVVLSGGREL
jgi:prepilin-type N-terminal cleavage/methylation domain-containing protein